MDELHFDDPRYPRQLLELRPPPKQLWVDGNIAVLGQPAMSIVGTRRLTGYGERVARDIAAACGQAGIVVVSGFAQGIDSAAHRGALDAGGSTIAVLGESIAAAKRVGGRRRLLLERIQRDGLLISEFAAPFAATPWSFPKRNRTIAALGNQLVVVEAGLSSGALITVRHARRIGRPVFAVPGPLGSAASTGTNMLIKLGLAKPLIDVRDVIPGVAPEARQKDPVLDLLRDGPLGLDEIARRGRLTGASVTARVASLLLRGEVQSLPDGRLRRA